MLYNTSAHAPAAQWIERLTSNWTGKVNILSMGVNYVHPLDGINKELSIRSTKSILSTLIAPALHQKQQLIQTDWRLDFKLICGNPLLYSTKIFTLCF